MCRMYASVGSRGPPAGELVAFRGLCETGCGGPHGDGWGLVGYHRPGAPHILGKSVRPASLDPEYATASSRAGDFAVVVGHLRKASSGGLQLDHTHPFTLGPWAFAHNGTISGNYPEKMAPGQAWNDSRTLFDRIVQRLGHAENPLQALRAAYGEVEDRKFPYSSVTTILTDGATLYATRLVREDFAQYELLWTKQDGRIVLSQEALFPGDWSSIPDRSIAVVRPGGIEISPL